MLPQEMVKVGFSMFLIGAVATGAPSWALGDSESPAYATENGDANGDNERDVSDAVYLLSHLFLGGPAPVPLAYCGMQKPVENGDTNGDAAVDISDSACLLGWLFIGGPAPVDACWGTNGGLGAGRNLNPRIIPPHARAWWTVGL